MTELYWGPQKFSTFEEMEEQHRKYISYFAICPICGAVIREPKLHGKWHAKLGETIEKDGDRGQS